MQIEDLPDDAYIRERQLIGERTPGEKKSRERGIVPFSSSTLWRRINAGEFPRPVSLGGRITAWRLGDVRRYLQAQGQPEKAA